MILLMLCKINQGVLKNDVMQKGGQVQVHKAWGTGAWWRREGGYTKPKLEWRHLWIIPYLWLVKSWTEWGQMRCWPKHFFSWTKKTVPRFFFLPSCFEAPIMQMGFGKCMWEPGVLLLFLLFAPSSCPCLNTQIHFWKKRLQEGLQKHTSNHIKWLFFSCNNKSSN